MFTDTYLDVLIVGIPLRDLAETYAGWMLGAEGDLQKSRRLEEGVRRDWTVERVLAGEPLIGDHSCRIDLRVTEAGMVARFIHRDTRDGAVIWNTVVRGTRHGDGVRIEHAVGRDAPRDYQLFPVAAAPRIITDLLSRDGVDVQPRQLAVPLARLTGDDAAGYVRHELLHDGRTVPVLAVACERGGTPLLVDAERLAMKLRGLVSVVALTTPESTFAFGDALEESGFGAEFRCFHGGAHLYGPAATMREDHRLWLGSTLRDIPEQARAERLAGRISHRVGVQNLPSGFFTLVEEHDREMRRALADRLARRESSRPPPPSGPSSEYFRQVEQELAEVRSALSVALEKEKEALEEWNKSDDARRDAERERENAEARLEQEKAISADLRDQFVTIKAQSFAPLSGEVVQALCATLSDDMTPEVCLRIVATAFPDRIVVLDDGYASAKKAREFRHVGKLAQLLLRLATDYYSALVDGKGDAEASVCFGEAFAAKESETTMSNAQAKRERSFRYAGNDLVMWPHLKIGVKESVAETIRVHFAWVPESKRIVIGWCGEHRYRVG